MTYELRTISSMRFIGISLLTLLTLIWLELELIGTVDGIFAIIFTILSMGLAWLAAKTFSTGRVNIDISDTEIQINWIKKPLLSLQKNTQIKIDQIIGWRFRPDSNFTMLKIFVSDNHNIKFERAEIWDNEKDDFGKFIRKFHGLINEENRKRKEEGKPEIVDKEVEYFQGIKAKLLYYFGIVFVIASGIVLIKNWDFGNTTTYYLIGAMSGGIFYIMRYRQMNKKYKKNDTPTPATRQAAEK